MSEDNDNRPGERRGRDAREERLKLALRENLKRRKLQARERRESDPSADAEASPHEGIAGKSAGKPSG